MFAGLLITVCYSALVWLVFFRLKLIRFSIGWGIASAFVGVHVLLIFLIGLRFVTPSSTDAKVVQQTIQLIPRLPEPTLVTAVLVEEGAHVVKGQPLFQFDRTVYEARVRHLEAERAEAQQNVKVLQADVALAEGKKIAAQANLAYADYRRNAAVTLRAESFGTLLQADQWTAEARRDAAAVDEADAEIKRAILKLESQIDGMNTRVAAVEAQLMQARYYLDNTTMVAPEDGRIVNLQVRPGMVSGIYRIGGIAAFIIDGGRYVLATYYQENLKYVRSGQLVEVALDPYPGQVFKATVDRIWRANATGQYLPSDVLPGFDAGDPHQAVGQFAVQINIDDKDQEKFPIGTHGVAAIYTRPGGGFAALRRISLRAHSWLNWLYPLSI
jgi:multidrug resistance efflux pump